MKRALFPFLLTLLLLAQPRILHATMSSSNYEIYADSFAVIQQIATSTDYTSYGTGSEFFATSTVGGTVILHGGFQAMSQGTLSLSLSKSAVSLGTVSQAMASEDSVVVTVGTDEPGGYTLAVSEDGNLRSGSNDINDVSDGSVTPGSEEYGIRTTGSHAFLSDDTAISNNLSVAGATGAATSVATTVIFRASAGSHTQSGSYSQTVTFTVTVNP